MRNSKIYSLFITLLICICSLVIGIWAARTASANASGSISFTSNGVWAEVSGTISGAGQIVNGSYKGTGSANFPTMEFDYRLNEGGQGVVKSGQSGVLPNWTSTNFNFNASGGDITITVTIKNMAPDRQLYAKISNNTNITNLRATMSGGEGNVIYIPANNTTAQTFTIKLALKNKQQAISSSTYSFNVQLSLNELEKDESQITANVSSVTFNMVNNSCYFYDNLYGYNTESFADLFTLADPDLKVTLTDSEGVLTIDGSGTSQTIYYDGEENLTGTLTCTIPDTGESVSIHYNTVYTFYSCVPVEYSDDGGHGTRCSVCGSQLEYESHTFSSYTNNGNNTHSATCTVCDRTVSQAHTVTSYSSNSSSHWGTCTLCGGTTTTASHMLRYKNDGSQHWQECSVCQYTTTKVYHNWYYEWDDEGCWQECACGRFGSQQHHEWFMDSDGEILCMYCYVPQSDVLAIMIKDYTPSYEVLSAHKDSQNFDANCQAIVYESCETCVAENSTLNNIVNAGVLDVVEKYQNNLLYNTKKQHLLKNKKLLI